jgi:hypothetical protein
VSRLSIWLAGRLALLLEHKQHSGIAMFWTNMISSPCSCEQALQRLNLALAGCQLVRQLALALPGLEDAHVT